MLDPLALMQLDIETLFRLDSNGCITGVNEPGDPGGPRFFMGCTMRGNFWRFHRDLPPDVAAELDAIAREEPVPIVLDGPPRQWSRFRHVLEAHRPVSAEFAGPAFRFPGRIQQPDGIAYLTPADRHRLPEDYSDVFDFPEDRQPCAVVLRGERAASVCFSSRSTHRAAEAGAETFPDFRRQGFGAKVVAGWAAAVQAQDRIPLYSTSWDNTASRALARHLGLEMYGAVMQFT